MMAKKLDSSSSMSIDDLKIRLNEYRFAVDGDREMLVRRLVDFEKSLVDTSNEAENQEDEDDQSNDTDGGGDDDDQIADH